MARVGLRGDECEIDIGVGAYDQFASAALSVDRDDAAALSVVVDMVRPHRVSESEPHPIGRLVRSRWLRSQIMNDPQIIEMANLMSERPAFARAVGFPDGGLNTLTGGRLARAAGFKTRHGASFGK